jgi:hypothetical protein
MCWNQMRRRPRVETNSAEEAFVQRLGYAAISLSELSHERSSCSPNYVHGQEFFEVSLRDTELYNGLVLVHWVGSDR